MTDIDLLPLPEGESSSFGNYEVHTNETMIEYARANVARNTALLRAEIEALRAEVDSLRSRLEDTTRDKLNAEAAQEDAARYRWLRKGESDDVAVVRGLGSADYGMSAVVYTFSEELDGDHLDAVIDNARRAEEKRK